MKRVITDVDGVLLDLLPTWLSLLGERTGFYIRPEEIEAYIPGEHWAAFYESLPRALELAPPMAGTSMLRGFPRDADLTVVSYIHPAARTFGYSRKLDWFENWFPGFNPASFCTMNGQRAYMQADYLIDDNPAHIAAWLKQNPQGEAFMVAHPYNLRSAILPRCSTVESFDEAAWAILTEEEST